MCCRYYFDEKTIADIERIVREVDHRVHAPRYHYGDVCPGDYAPIIIADQNRLSVRDMKWGFTNPINKSLVINATSENASQRPLFHNHLSSRRCAVPAAHFYEWDTSKQKSTFSLEQDPKTMYLAGIYNLQDNEDRFVIFTTKANNSMIPVHDRMPLILSEEDMLNLWLSEGEEGLSCLKKESPELYRETQYEQLSFVDINLL